MQGSVGDYALAEPEHNKQLTLRCLMRCGLRVLVSEKHRSIRWRAAGSSASVGIEWEMRRNELRVF